MFKLAFGNEDQCPAQCTEKYKQTQDVVGMHDSFIRTIGKLLNETDDIIQGMDNADYQEDLMKYQDISTLARDVFSIFSNIPKANRQVAKMMMRLIKLGKEGDRDDDKNRPRPRPRPRPGNTGMYRNYVPFCVCIT